MFKKTAKSLNSVIPLQEEYILDHLLTTQE